MITVGQAKTWIAEQLHEDETDAVLAGTSPFRQAPFPRWITQSRDRIVSYTSWRWNEDQMRLTWGAPGAGEEASILYLPNVIDRLKTLYPGSAVGTGSVNIVTATEIDKWRPVAGRDVGQDYLVLHGWYGVENEMAADSVVTIASSAGSGNQTVMVEGLNPTNNDIQREEITVAAGGVQAGTLTFKAGVGGVKRITLIGDSTGTPVTTTGIITATGGGVELVRLDSSWEIGREHRRTELYATSSSQSSYTARYWRRHYPLLRDQDVVDIPEYFHDVFELGLGMKLAQFRQRAEEYVMLAGEWRERMIELLAYDKREPGRKYKMRVRSQWGSRRFGHR